MESQEAMRKIHSAGAEDASPGLVQETGSCWMFTLPFLHGPLYTLLSKYPSDSLRQWCLSALNALPLKPR